MPRCLPPKEGAVPIATRPPDDPGGRDHFTHLPDANLEFAGPKGFFTSIWRRQNADGCCIWDTLPSGRSVLDQFDAAGLFGSQLKAEPFFQPMTV